MRKFEEAVVSFLASTVFEASYLIPLFAFSALKHAAAASSSSIGQLPTPIVFGATYLSEVHEKMEGMFGYFVSMDDCVPIGVPRRFFNESLL